MNYDLFKKNIYIWINLPGDIKSHYIKLHLYLLQN